MLLRFFLFCLKIALMMSIVGVIIASIVVYIYSRDLPDHSELDKYYPPSITRMYSSDGKLIEEYAKEHRIFVPINSIPKQLSEAFIAAEDKNFYSHPGLDFIGIIRASVSNVYNVVKGRRMEGASTITQQVVKNFLLSSERSLDRKIKEAILSYRISQLFTKEEVLELYLNQIYLGKGAHGVATAALHYFNKSVEELTLNECAVLASLPKAPSKYNPAKNYKRAFQRKNYVLLRMYEDGYITEEEARNTTKEPIKLAKFDKIQTLDADYYASRVRAEIIGMFGEEYFYTAGLTVITCADSVMQNAAGEALRRGIKNYDMKRGYRGPLRKISIDNWKKKLNELKIPAGLRQYKMAVVLNVENDKALIGIRDGSKHHIYLKDMKWAATNIKSVHKILKKGYVVAIEQKDKKYELQQIPKVNGGIMAVDHSTGRVLAAIGGYDFDGSKFDRTTQAKRQPGSLIKPFVYLAALEKGAEPNDIYEDAPIDVHQGRGMPIWRPKNHDSKFQGPMTLRRGLEKSRNTVTVRVGQTAGLNNILKLIRRFGINENPARRHSIVLGSLETTLSNMVTAYGSIANGGKKLEPHYIEMIKDRKGNVIYKRDYTECSICKKGKVNATGKLIVPNIEKPSMEKIADDATTYQMTSILEGGVKFGTSRRASKLKHNIAGKTGTTNDAKDAWFVGFTPQIVVGTYVGFDNPRTLGKRAYGSNTALPIFVDFMKNGYENQPIVKFPVPKSIELKPIDRETGQLSWDSNGFIEAFKSYNYRPKDYNSALEDRKEEDGMIVPDSNPDAGEETVNNIDIEKYNIEDNKNIAPSDADPFSRIQERDQSHELY